MTRTLQIVNGNVVRSKASGRLVSITDKAKAEQSLKRLLSLDQPSGAGLDALIGTVPDNEFALSVQGQQNIRQAFDALVRAQRGNQLAQRTTQERLSTIQRMYFVPANFGGGNSKTGYAFRVDATTVAGETVSTGGVLVPPQG
jgi:hypothetical protein